MTDVRVAELAGRQFNRISRRQFRELGLSANAIAHRLATGRFVAVAEAVFAIAPVLDDDWGRWMGATLTAPRTFLTHFSGAAAWGCWSLPRPIETVTRPGSGGPRRLDGVLVHRSIVLPGDVTELRGIPITTPARTLLDLAPRVSERALARTLRTAVREGVVTLPEIGDCLGRHPRRRGSRRLADAIERYSGLPLARARSGSEIRALEIIRAAGAPLPNLNARINGEEADLSWPEHRLILEIDGGPFHLDVGEDARKEAVWAKAGWQVRRLPSDQVYARPGALLALVPPASRDERP